MKNEFPIWGIKENEVNETLLYTKCKTLKDAQVIKNLLINKYKCSKVRIQILEFNNKLNFNGVINI